MKNINTAIVAIVAVFAIVLLTIYARPQPQQESTVCEAVQVIDGKTMCLTGSQTEDIVGSATEAGFCYDKCVKYDGDARCNVWMKICTNPSIGFVVRF